MRLKEYSQMCGNKALGFCLGYSAYRVDLHERERNITEFPRIIDLYSNLDEQTVSTPFG